MENLAAMEFSQEVLDLVRKHGGSNMRLAVEKIIMAGLRALETLGFVVIEGEELNAKARVIKKPYEIISDALRQSCLLNLNAGHGRRGD